MSVVRHQLRFWLPPAQRCLCRLPDDELCTYSIEHHRDFFETECAQNVTHLFDMLVWLNECAALDTKRRCKAEKMCAW